MAAVGGGDAVVLTQLRGHANADSLLARVEVAKAANVLGAVQLVGHGLHAADHAHLRKQVPGLVLVELHGRRGSILQLVQLEAVLLGEKGGGGGEGSGM